MAVGDRQKLITNIVADVLGQPPEIGRSFSWLRNRHTPEYFGLHYKLMDRIYLMLGGTTSDNKREKALSCDAYFGGDHNFIFEFDEFQHFSSARLTTLDMLPENIPLGFSLSDYKRFCAQHREAADDYRRSKRTKDFDFVGGRTAQRAYFDTFRDLLPSLHGLNPTVRVAEFEVEPVLANDAAGRSLVGRVLEHKLARTT